MATPNPNNFQTSQNFKIDINKIYSDFIQEIDANRSIVNVNIQVNQGALNSFDAKTIAGISKSLKIEATPQESRLHCFFRLIGFPVVSKDAALYYNPGLDIIEGFKNITLEKKIEIANSPFPEFKRFSANRENYTNSIQAVWSKRPATITASALALSSSVNVRPFSAPVKNDEPFSFNPADQSYVADLRSIIGSNNTVKLNEYVDALGNKPDANQLLLTRAHFIKPFMVDPRIDFSCNPSSRRVAVPFVYEKANLLVSENTFVKRPLIEKIIRERFTVQNQNNISESQSKLRDIILNMPTINDEALINRMTSDINGLDDNFQFQKYIFIIEAMCRELVKAQTTIQTVQSQHYWLPLPSVSGPEGGSDVSPLIISTTLPSGDNNSFITVADRNLINATLNQAANQFNAQTSNAENTSSKAQDPGDFLFREFDLTFSNDTSQAMGDMVQEQLEYLNTQRNHALTEANDALRTVEIIMGEFSGLGLCDIIAVMGALYVMPRNDLLGFLDEDAFNRMITTLNLQFSGLSNPGIMKAQTSFIAKVKDFYNLMDDIYKQLSKNNGLSS